MAIHNEIGKQGELLAYTFLQKKGYKIVEQNWRFKRAEIDLIAMDRKTLVFVEVKTRSREDYGTPESFVDAKKEALLLDAANAYMQQIDFDWAIRFDIIAVSLKKQHVIIEHFEDAFFPTWDEY